MAQINCKCGEPLTIAPDATHISCPACKAIFRVRSAPASNAAAAAPATAAKLSAPPVVAPAPPAPVVSAPRDDDESDDAAWLSGPPDAGPQAPPETKTGVLETPRSAEPTPGRTPAKLPAPKRAVVRPPARQRLEQQPETPPRSKMPLLFCAAGGLMTLAACALFVVGALDKNAPHRPLLEQQKAELNQKIAEAQRSLVSEQKEQDTVRAKIAAAAKKAAELSYDEQMLDHRFSAAAAGTNVNVALQERAVVEQAFRDTKGKVERRAEAGDITKVIARAEKTVIIIRTDKGSGSGFLLRADGLAATNYHVIEGARKLMVRIQKRDSREQIDLVGARVIAANKDRDLALLQLPPAPAAVADAGGYPSVVLHEGDAAAGEAVIVIGNPGLQAKILDYTATTGIVSNAHRTYGTIQMIQTSAPVNPGNSGGPLFDAAGFLLGVVSAKGIDVENVAFAIPAAALTELVEKRKEEDYAVENLADWERKNNPALSATFGDEALQARYAVPLPDNCSRMLLSADGKILYLLFGHSGKIQEYLIAENKPGKICDAGCQLEDFWLRGTSGTIAAVSATTKKLLTVNPKTMIIDKSAILRSAPATASYLGGSGEYLVLSNPGGEAAESYFAGPGEMSGSGPAGIELPRGLLALSSASNAKWAVLETFNADNQSIALHAYPVDPFMQLLKDWSAVRQKNNSMKQADVAAKLEELNEKLTAIERKFELPQQRGRDGFGPILFLGPDRIVAGRHAYKLNEKIEDDFEFEENPLLKNDALTGAQQKLYADGDTIRKVAPNGKAAASRTHVYDAATGKILRKIPFLCSQPVFSRDGKTLYALDGTQHYLYRFKDWETALEAP